MEIFGVSKYVSTPLAAVVVWFLIVKADYKTVERIFLVASALYLCYVASGILENPPWRVVLQSLHTRAFASKQGT